MNKNVLEVKRKGVLYAMIFLRSKRPAGIYFATPTDLPIQVGWHTQKKERNVPLHRHPHLAYKVKVTHEFLYVEKGLITIEITDSRWRLIKKIKLSRGDSILIMNGGHHIVIGKNTNILEVKQGPYPGDEKAKIYKK